MDIKKFNEIWRLYSDVFYGRDVNNENISFPVTDGGSLKERNNTLVIYNGSRQPVISRIKTAVESLLKIEDNNPINIKYLNIGRKKEKTKLSYSLFFFFGLVFKYSLLNFFKTRSFYYSVYIACCKYLQKNNVSTLMFFTENNRLTEVMRIAANNLGVKQYVFLHGITSERFSEYYKLLYKNNSSLVKFINIYPNLPQPILVQDNQVIKDGKVVYFINDFKWSRFDPLEDNKLIIIVGGDVVTGEYSSSKFFKNELRLMALLNEKDIGFVYCPHPRVKSKILSLLPEYIEIRATSEASSFGSFYIGHYSTVLFNAYLNGFPVLIFEDAISELPSDVGEVMDINACVLDFANIESQLLSQGSRLTNVEGIDLEEL